ncbi:MAG TPA: hypothetical protein VMB26_03440 [Candidatus Binataceae bacterium]|nr:hypothetical protein [Candidatus Binataceae bacterium]
MSKEADVPPAAAGPRLDPRIPLVVGVTGHRDLRAKARNEMVRLVREVFARIKVRLPNTPLVLLSPLAEGADRLVAEVALSPEVGAQVVAVLPMPRALYERDFASAESRAEFARLLGSATSVLELPLPSNLSPAAFQDDEQARIKQYLAVGEFVTRECQVLIALWNGAAGETAGTGSVVTLKLTGHWPTQFVQHGAIDELVSPGPVFHIKAPRERDPGDSTAISLTEIYPKNDAYGPAESARVYAARMFEPLDTYNRELAESSADEVAARQRAATDLIPSLDQPVLAPIRSALELIRGQYASADVLANHYRSLTVATLFRVSIVVFFGALAFDSSLHLLLGGSGEVHLIKAICMFASPVLMVIALMIYRRAKRDSYQNKYQDYRGLAEGLRVQFFWRLAGVNEAVADHYLGRHRWELEWVRAACRAALVAAGFPLGPVCTETRQIAIENWVDPQHAYLTGAIERQERKIESFENLMRICFWAGLAGIVTLSFLIGWEVFDRGSDTLAFFVGENSELHGFLLLLITMSAVAAALIHNYIEKLALAPQVRMYQGMKRLYQRYAERLRAVPDSDVTEALSKLGQAALMENGDWIIAHRERPLEVPHH